jgi:ADP-L-glycero-D-manno-heptose 6-epimerase
MKILVTGGTGFIGSNITNKLVDMGHEVTVIGCKTEQKTRAARYLELHFDGVDWESVGDQDVLFHEAANNDTLDLNEDEMLRANVYTPLRMFYRLALLGCRQFVYASSTAIYGDSPAPYIEGVTPPSPLNPYGRSKYLFEKLIMEMPKKMNVNVVGLRYCNVYGPGEEHKGHRASMIYQLAQSMIEGNRPKLFKHGEQKRDWINVEDVVSANLLAMDYQGCGVFNCGSGQATSFNDLVKIINKGIADLHPHLYPVWIGNPYKKRYQEYTECDMTKAKEELGFVPKIDIETGIENYLKWLRK